MATFEIINELYLKATFNSGEPVHAKAGSMLAYQGNMKFEKELLGPGNGVAAQAVGQLMRRFTGENLPLMRCIPQSPTECYFGNEGQHVVVLHLQQGERLAVESESILAFTDQCKYGVMFLPLGVVSQKGLATSTLEAMGPDAYAAVLVDGNPVVLRGQSVVDPDCMVCFTGNQPSFGMDINFRNLIGQASGESYHMKFNDPNNIVIIQPSERKSGIDIGMDGRGGRPTRQDNNLFRSDGNQMFRQQNGNNMGGNIGNILGQFLNS